MPQSCCHRNCKRDAVVSWQRRPTPDELAAIHAAETARHNEALLLADPRQSPPTFDSMPEANEVALAVYACADHAISLDLAAAIHAADCGAPHPDRLPACNCTPEPLAAVPDEPQAVTLPTGWTIPA